MERRLAAILAADMVGYSRLMGADEEGTITRQRAHHEALIDPQIASHGGRIVKTMGDGLLVEFPSVVDALKCAVALQAGLAEREGEAPDERRIQYRIGINLGDIVIDGDDILGDGVNVAARLEGLAEPGGICISGVVHQSVEGKLDLSFADMGAQQVKNIAKPVRAYQVLLSGAPDPSTDEQRLSDKPSIAVLPFDNMSGDPEQEYFSDGMAEDLITDLSKISSLSVAARNSSFSFKGQMPDIKDVVEKLGVTFILEGSVRKMGNRLRINAQLIDGADGRHIWADRYDGNMAEIFEFQDAIREQIVSALQVSLTPADKALAERKPTDSAEAYDLFLKGRANLHHFTNEHVLEAKKYFEAAIGIDPNFADAYGYLSYCHFAGWILMFPGFDDTLERANELAEKGVALDGTSAIAVARLGWIQGWMRRFDQAVANYEKAIALAPNSAEVYADFGQVLNYWGNPERALEMSEKVFRLDTFAPPLWEFYAGHSHYLLRQYDQALTRINRMLERVPKFITAHAYLACVYVELDRLDDANESIKTVLDISPQYTVKELDRIHPYRIDEIRNRFLDNLRKAGLPEGIEAEEGPPPLPDKPSIAVLPFDNMSGDPEQGYFADGIAEDIITALSRFRRLFVTARNTSFAHRGGAGDLAVLGRELGVRYLLEGSVRKAGNRVRITAQLIETESGNHVWAERYDRDLDDIFGVQDEITRHIAVALEPAITLAEIERAKTNRSISISAWDYYLRALPHFHQVTPEDNTLTMAELGKAIELDPEYVPAIALLSLCHVYSVLHGWSTSRSSTIEEAGRLAERALSIDPSDPAANLALSWYCLYDDQLERGLTAAKNAAEQEPNSFIAWCQVGALFAHLGRAEEAYEALQTVEQMSGRDPWRWWWYMNWGNAYFAGGRYDDAVDILLRGKELRPSWYGFYVIMAASAAIAGRVEVARQAVADLLRVLPRATMRGFERHPAFVEQSAIDALLGGLREAGVPEE